MIEDKTQINQRKQEQILSPQTLLLFRVVCFGTVWIREEGHFLINGRKSAVWLTKIMPKKADEKVNRRKKE